MKRKLFDATGWFDSENGVYAEVSAPSRGKTPGFSATMEIDDFCSAVSGATVQRKENTVSFCLSEIPPNLWAVKTVLGTDGTIKGLTAVFAMPEGKARFKYEDRSGTEKFDGIIPWPKLVFIAQSTNGNSSGLKVFCHKDSVLTKDTKLYHYPFGNVYQDGGVCMGGYHQTVTSLMGLCDYVDAFYKMVTNADLWRTDYSNFHMSQKEALEKISKLEKFPGEYLKEIGKTLRTVLPTGI